MTEPENKFRCQVAVTKEFEKSYFESDKRQSKLDHLLVGLNAVVSLEENCQCAAQSATLLIEADSEQSVQRAQMKVTQALFALSTRSSFTHLVSIPFTEPTFVASYLQFKDTVLSTFGHCAGIDESLFQNAKKLHLTISVLTLVSDEHVKEASAILQREWRHLVDSGLDLNRKIHVKGLSTMNGDPTRTNVLYAKVEDESLQKVADRIATEMATNGLVFNDDKLGQSVKLHITLMNTALARRKAAKNRKRKIGKIPVPKHFDCSAILEHYKDFVFAEMNLPPLQLNDVRLESEQGYYKVIDSVELSPTGK